MYLVKIIPALVIFHFVVLFVLICFLLCCCSFFVCPFYCSLFVRMGCTSCMHKNNINKCMTYCSMWHLKWIVTDCILNSPYIHSLYHPFISTFILWLSCHGVSVIDFGLSAVGWAGWGSRGNTSTKTRNCCGRWNKEERGTLRSENGQMNLCHVRSWARWR